MSNDKQSQEREELKRLAKEVLLLEVINEVHTESHPLAGKTVRIKDSVKGENMGAPLAGSAYRIDDWWDKLTGKSWMDAEGNPAAWHYALRSGRAGLPIDDDVVYGLVGMFGVLMHVSEIEEI
jgi:hypothetical protein